MVQDDGGDGSASTDFENSNTTGDSTASAGDGSAATGDSTASFGDGSASDGSSSTGFGNPEGRDSTGRGLTPQQEEDENDSLFWDVVSYATGYESQGSDTILGSFWSTESEE